MLYQKNLPGWERGIRVVAGAATGAYGAEGLRGAAMAVALLVGAVLVATGFVGFCPACALAGRRLKNPDR